MKRQRIVVTDGFTLNPGDLDWQELERIGDLDIHERTAPAELVERCREATIIVTNKTPVGGEDLALLRALKMIAVTATGYNIIDVDVAKRRGIVVCNVPGYGTDSVTQHTFALLLELTNHAGINSRSAAMGDWSRASDWCYTLKPLVELAGKTIGIVGYGKIGQKVAEIALAFGMKVLYFNPRPKNGPGTAVEIERLFRESDIVSLHCPLTRENHGFVNAALLGLMKPTSFFINTARGQLVNENDLAEALRKGSIAGAALDVLSKEPPPANHPLIGLPNCIVTPHNAWLSYEARKRILDVTIANIRGFLEGKPQNIVNL